MGDLIDRANDLAHEQTEEAIRAARDEASASSVGFTGYCLHCGEDVESPRRWCDAECRDAWEAGS